MVKVGDKMIKDGDQVQQNDQHTNLPLLVILPMVKVGDQVQKLATK